MNPTSERDYQPPAIPLDEETRLHSLRELKLLDTELEERFDRVVKLAAAVFQVPMIVRVYRRFKQMWQNCCSHELAFILRGATHGSPGIGMRFRKTAKEVVHK